MPSLRHKRKGLTALELISVVAIVGLLLALLLPAIQDAREAARRAQCRGNLRQIGIAIHNYHSVHRCFPPGCLSSTERLEHDGWGWATFLLPHVDQQALYNQLDPQGQPYIFRDYFAAHGHIIPDGDTVVSVYRCPSSGLGDLSEAPGPSAPLPHRIGYATGDYKGSVGDGHGIFTAHYNEYRDPPVPLRMSNVPDGASTTIAVAESSYPGRRADAWPTWAGNMGGKHCVLFDTTLINAGVDHFGDRFWETAGADQSALSFHEGGAQFLFVDGSVHFLDENIDRFTYRWLTYRDDGRAVSGF